MRKFYSMRQKAHKIKGDTLVFSVNSLRALCKISKSNAIAERELQLITAGYNVESIQKI